MTIRFAGIGGYEPVIVLNEKSGGLQDIVLPGMIGFGNRMSRKGDIIDAFKKNLFCRMCISNFVYGRVFRFGAPYHKR
ncbi:MAG: hypothetical protein NC489_26275 [Ruminococcus flavefaciens]|nr:hypothetical protein [Ruminococcus flavefaciens]